MSTGYPTAIEVLEKRFSASQFDPTKSLSIEEIKELVRLASQAPSSFNIQHWRFVAVIEKSDKERLKAVAYGQQKVADAAVTFIVLGDLKGYEKIPEAYAPLLTANSLNQKSLDGLFENAKRMYANNPQLQRDEAIRSSAMASMNLMNAATAKGLISGPMISFDPAGVKREFGISDRYVPVMLIAVGYEARGNWPKKPRLPVDAILSFGKGREF